MHSISYPLPTNNNNMNRATGRHTTHPRLRQSRSFLWYDILIRSLTICWNWVDIRNAADAQVVFEAVRLNILPMIRRRLGPTERDILRSGEIFVWEETDQKGGLERWTDGRRWYSDTRLPRQAVH